jgi:pyruvate carboxylase
LFKLVQSQNRAQKLLAYLGDLAVNGSSIKGQSVGTNELEIVEFMPTLFLL